MEVTMVPTKNEIDMAFRMWICNVVNKTSLSQHILAYKAQVSQAMINNIINGKKNPSDMTMKKILIAAGVDYQDAMRPYIKKIMETPVACPEGERL
ncbi:hypothetical protein C4J81_17210 [Deltaproteobacteria bacterium Smac51]|nr:hypothetical protein C4J81_17210 [Deltaproteobacteria bacterium Smac51]